eukprot:TRINITY_DN33891_c0_g1_i1.p1 TRINITY_DN33891_c0_g1~~TRINITY_DN33891_c0_g1_i1.p1  ORF type:complete len:218 (-),score=49.93 TRINITY_DN33891_c0_g1_i1:110-763(-)
MSHTTQYAAFSSLPGVGSCFAGCPATAAADAALHTDPFGTSAAADDAAARAVCAFDFAREVVEQNQRRMSQRAVLDEERRQRKAAMKVAIEAASDSENKTPTATATPVQVELASVSGGGYSNAAAAPEKAKIHLRMPNGRILEEDFLPSQGAFDVYVKVYEQLENKERYFRMDLRGPRNVPFQQHITKELDQTTWNLTLSSLGVKAGDVFDLDITQR